VKARSISDRRRWHPWRHYLLEGVTTEVRLGHVVAFGGCFRLLGPDLHVVGGLLHKVEVAMSGDVAQQR
jgi:hypothetical protein